MDSAESRLFLTECDSEVQAGHRSVAAFSRPCLSQWLPRYIPLMEKAVELQ